MTRFPAAMLVLALTLSACGGGAGATPKSTFEASKNAVANKDWSALFDLIAPSARKKMEKEFEDQKKLMDNPESMEAKMLMGMLGISAEEMKNMTMRDMFVKMMTTATKMNSDEVARMKTAKIVETRIDGDKATMKVKMGDREKTITLVREDGKWYMPSMN